MTVIYNIIFRAGPDAPSPEGTEQVSALVSQIETEAHRWMQEQYPDVKFETMRAFNSDDHGRVMAETQEEQARGEQILHELDEYVGQKVEEWS